MARFPVAVAVAVVLAVAGAAPALAQPSESDRFGSPVYLALGDSVAAGVGAQPYVTGYPEQVGALLEQGYNTFADKATPHAVTDIDVVNYAVGGATTATLIATQLPKAIQLIEQRNGDRDPFNDVEVITLTIGGNDVFSPAVAACVTAAVPQADCQRAVDAALAAAHTGLIELLEQLTAAAGRDTEVVITTYYNPLAACHLGLFNPAAVAIADVVLEGGTVAGLLSVEDGLNDLIRHAAAATGVQVANLYGALAAGEYVGGRDCLHPNLAGHVTIAEVVYDTIAR